jgi:hypothetical protein
MEGNIAYVPLTRGYEAVIDACDVDIVAHKLWHAHVRYNRDGTIKSIYAHTNIRGQDGQWRIAKMHRVIANPAQHQEVDHISGYGLDNRRENLRCCLRHENMANQKIRADNKSGAKGVRFYERSKKWHARITSNGVSYHLGYFDTMKEAVNAYAEASARMHGNFRRACA